MRACELTGLSKLKGNRIAITRSKVSKRTIRFFQPNLQNKKFTTEHLGVFSIKVSTRVLRTIDKYNGIEAFLLKTKRNKLTDLGRKLRKKLRKISVNKS